LRIASLQPNLRDAVQLQLPVVQSDYQSIIKENDDDDDDARMEDDSVVLPVSYEVLEKKPVGRFPMLCFD